MVFEKTLAKLSTYSQEKAPLEVWLFAIARNVVNDHYRSLKRRSFFSLDAVKELVSSRKDPESMILQGERNGKLINALNTLNSRERNIVALKFGANLSRWLMLLIGMQRYWKPALCGLFESKLFL
ncbi:hypothetical protein [Paenibacillus sp. FSL P4-0184]|uniref:hypothetical protein n=1 Tax=Paenibacillus sp. FSL P4-0184 TaxID=2921632 RepID=UPI0030FC15BA